MTLSKLAVCAILTAGFPAPLAPVAHAQDAMKKTEMKKGSMMHKDGMKKKHSMMKGDAMQKNQTDQ